MFNTFRSLFRTGHSRRRWQQFVDHHLNSMKKILTIITILLILTSCDNKVYYDIPENEKSLLINNDTVYFNCNRNKIDTFIIKITNDYEISDKRYYQEFFNIRYKMINKTKTPLNFLIQQGGSTSISVNGNYFPSIYKKDNVIELNINEIKYKDVYEKYKNNVPDSIPQLVYYSLSHGILKYEFSDSIIYEIKNK